MKSVKPKRRRLARVAKCVTKAKCEGAKGACGCKNAAAPVSFFGKLRLRADIRGVFVLLSDDNELARVSIHEMQTAGSAASKLRRLFQMPWMTRELFAETLDHVCAVLNVR